MLKEFREFAVRGNVVDLAVAVIIGAAFGRIVTSLVNDVIMPPIGLLTGNLDFSSLFINLGTTKYQTLAAAHAAGAPTLNYGTFINTIVSFLIVAFWVFFMVRAINRLRRKEDVKEEEPAAPTTKNCPYCVSTIPLQATRCPACTSTLEP